MQSSSHCGPSNSCTRQHLGPAHLCKLLRQNISVGSSPPFNKLSRWLRYSLELWINASVSPPSRLQSSLQPLAECSWYTSMLVAPAFPPPKPPSSPWACFSEGNNWPVGGEKLSEWLVIYQEEITFPDLMLCGKTGPDALMPWSEGNEYSTERIRCLKLPLSIN